MTCKRVELRIAPTIGVEKIEPRRKKPPALIPTFCPFCGTRFMAEAAEDASSTSPSPGRTAPSSTGA